MNRHFSDYKLLKKLFFRLLPYQLMLLIIDAANGIVDSLCASNFIGKTAMSAIGFYCPLTHLLFAVSIMFVSGSQLLVGEAMGKNKTRSVQSLFSTDLFFSFVVSVILTAVLIIFGLTDLARFLVQNESERQVMNMYIIGQACGIPALVMGQQLFSFLSMENRRKLTMIASLVCFAANSVMDIVFVRVFNMGTLGLGLASAAALWAFFFTMAQYYFKGKSELKLTFRSFEFRRVKRIVKKGYPGAISRFLEMFRCVIVTILILKYIGSIGLSAFAAVNSVMAVFWPVAFGMMAVMRMLLGISIGEEDRKSVADIMRILFFRGTLLQIAITAGIVLLAVPFTSMFYHDAADPVYQMTLNGFRLLPLCMPLSILSLGMAGYAQATENRFLSHVLPIVDGAGGVVACSLFLIPSMGMTGLYIANILNGVICAVIIIAYATAHNKHFPKTFEEFIVLPKDFGAPEDERIDIEVRDIEEVNCVSKQVTEFCAAKDIDERRACFAGLALEEMAGNVVEHGYTKDNKSHEIDIRVVHKDDDVVLRFTDDCVAFDPLKRVKDMDEGDVCSNIGIRMVNSLAKDISYQNLLGLNVLTIRI